MEKEIKENKIGPSTRYFPARPPPVGPLHFSLQGGRLRHMTGDIIPLGVEMLDMPLKINICTLKHG